MSDPIPRAFELQHVRVVLVPTKTTAVVSLFYEEGRIDFTVPIGKIVEMREMLDNVIGMARPN
jgi:hypothetical protein